MNTERWHRLEELFEEVLEMPPADRAAYLETACGPDEALRREARSLLAAFEEAPVYFDRLSRAVLGSGPGDGDPFVPALCPGQTVGPYEIRETLGGGGMGVVYRGWDRRLDRWVALKFLPPELSGDEAAKARFRQEARAASALDHPQICPVHDIGETTGGQLFLVMPCYAGETLKKKIARGPLPIAEAVGYASQIAEGLEAAHAAGIVHRDIKPANVMVTAEGAVKIVDFGLAQMAGAELTRTGARMGTAAYMSPEQARGEAVDRRTDLWALGVVLYEMLTGERPFAGKRPSAVIYNILHETPRSLKELRPEMPEFLADILAHLLAKDATDRHPNAAALLEDLRASSRGTNGPGRGAPKRYVRKLRAGVRGGGLFVLTILVLVLALGASSYFLWAGNDSPPGPIRSLAVLPLENLSEDEGREYFSDGMTEALISALARLEELQVISRTSAMQYKNTNKPIPQIARELGVDGIIEGSVLTAGDRVRVSLQLIDGRSDRHLWAESYERPLKDILRLQGEVARVVAGELALQVEPREERLLAQAAPTAPTVDPEAYRLYLQGRHLRFRETSESLTEAVRLLLRSIAVDSTFAPAWAVLSTAVFQTISEGGQLPPGLDARALIKSAATRALELDSTSAEAHVAMGNVREMLEGNMPAAGPHFQRAVQLDPGHANAHREYGLYFMRLGQFTVAERYLAKAARLDPIAGGVHSNLGWNDLYRGNYEEAKEHLKQGLALWDNRPVMHAILGEIYLAQDSVEAGTREMRLAARANPSPWTYAGMGWAHAKAGRRDSAEVMLHRIRQEFDSSPVFEAAVYAALEEPDRALDLLEQTEFLSPIKVLHVFRPLHDEPRFQRLLEKAGLDEASIRRTMELLSESA